MRAWWAWVMLGACGCVHLTPFSPRALSGQTFSIRPGWAMALHLDGSVGGRPALIRLAVEEPLSRVTEGCFETSPDVVARVATEGAQDGGTAIARRVEDQVVAPSVQLGSRVLGDVQALRDSGKQCELTLGSEILIGFVLEVRPGARTVTFHAEMPVSPAFQSEGSVVLELTRDPRTDRPSLGVQVDTSGSPLTLPMVLATAQASVQISAEAGRLLAGSDTAGTDVALASLAFAPGWTLHHVIATVLGQAPQDAPPTGSAVAAQAPPSVPSGVLGAEAWGHYRALIDLRGQQLVLFRRPPAIPGESGPVSWTQLSSDSTATGSLVRLISWETLDHGGQVALEPAHVPVKSCRVGLTLSPEDPGASLEVAIPWPALAKEMPDCARELASVPAWTGELDVSEKRLCSGTCLYAQDVATGKTVCACSGRSKGVRAVVPQSPAHPAPEGAEPNDPPAPRAPSR